MMGKIFLSILLIVLSDKGLAQYRYDTEGGLHRFGSWYGQQLSGKMDDSNESAVVTPSLEKDTSGEYVAMLRTNCVNDILSLLIIDDQFRLGERRCNEESDSCVEYQEIRIRFDDSSPLPGKLLYADRTQGPLMLYESALHASNITNYERLRVELSTESGGEFKNVFSFELYGLDKALAWCSSVM